jgi:glycosyltransferase involved in cell wall biosynthesis
MGVTRIGRSGAWIYAPGPVQSEPSVSVILPVLNEAESIDDVLGDILAQDYPGPLEVIVADGGSGDGTLERLEGWTKRDSRVIVVHNPRRRQAFGLNVAAARAAGSVLVRADGHTRYAPDYVSRSVRALEELGGAVGGPMTPQGATSFGRAVAAAMNSPLTMGPGRFHHAVAREEVDTVYLGSFELSDFEAIGGFRALPSGSSEDADFYFRWRRSGLRVHVDPAIVSTYRPRDTPGELWRQYFRYGLGKAEMLWLNRSLPSPRPLAPMLLVVALAATLVLGAFTADWWPAVVAVGSWALLLIFVAARSTAPSVGVVAAAGIMHLAYGVGIVWGLLRGPGPIRHLRSGECDTSP